MKKLPLLFPVLMLAFAACNHPAAVMPVDPATLVAGTYTLGSLQKDSSGVALSSYTLPLTMPSDSISGSVTATADSVGRVLMTQLLKSSGNPDQNTTIGEVYVKASTTVTTPISYDLYLGTQKIGTSDGTHLSLTTQKTDSTGVVYQTIETATK